MGSPSSRSSPGGSPAASPLATPRAAAPPDRSPGTRPSRAPSTAGLARSAPARLPSRPLAGPPPTSCGPPGKPSPSPPPANPGSANPPSANLPSASKPAPAPPSRRIAARDVQARPAQAREPGAHPLPQFGGRLAGEGEAEYPFRPDHAVGDQPDQPGGHRLALARARAGDDRERLQRRGDHLGLLRSGLGQAEQPGQVPGLVTDRAHGLPRRMSCHRRARQHRASSFLTGGPVISWPPSRALRWLREACPRRRDTATAPEAPYAAFGPAAGA